MFPVQMLIGKASYNTFMRSVQKAIGKPMQLDIKLSVFKNVVVLELNLQL